MDEIDAVGRHRGAGLGGGHDEREQTLNQLLVEMDGFELKDNVILIAATNRPDILDPALLRPGRFDRQIVVDRPDRNGRRKILEVHTKGKPLATEIDLDTLAAGTPGFTGADLANLVNEAALLAARRGKKTIDMIELEEGIMRVIAGPEKRTRLLSEHERKVTAYHEMGHALVGHYLPNCDPVHKISVISRGQALGYTISLPREDRFLQTKSALLDQMAMTLGGRAAEELVVPRDHDRRRERPREGDAHGEADDHALRHEREAGAAHARAQSRHALPRPRHGRRARLLRRDRTGDRRRDPPHRRGGPRAGQACAHRADGRSARDLAAPDRARDDRQGPVRAPARRGARGVGVRRAAARPEPMPEPEPEPEHKPRVEPQPRRFRGPPPEDAAVDAQRAGNDTAAGATWPRARNHGGVLRTRASDLTARTASSCRSTTYLELFADANADAAPVGHCVGASAWRALQPRTPVRPSSLPKTTGPACRSRTAPSPLRAGCLAS